MKILGIESSCDETAIAIIEIKASTKVFSLLSHSLSSQIKIHRKYGGVVPEVAARDHVVKIIPVLQTAVRKAGISLSALDAIAYTESPGLITSLLVGKYTAEALGYALQIPVKGIHHIYAHMLSPLIKHGEGKLKLSGDAIALTVSGGHTQLFKVKQDLSYSLIGQTRDDAAGEAFDKIAKIMGLEYPGGPVLAKLSKHGNANRFNLPRPMIDSGDFDFSFSGLKTAVLYLVRGVPLKKETKRINKKISTKSRGLSMNKKNMYDLAASVQQAIVDVLISKTLKAVDKYGVKTVILAGGVSANDMLRSEFQRHLKARGILFLRPEKQFCTDNAVMVALAGAQKFLS